MTLARVTEIHEYITADGSHEVLIGVGPYEPIPGGYTHARVIWIDESGNASLAARKRARLDEIVMLLPHGRAFGLIAALEVAQADVRARFQHARLIPLVGGGYVIGVPHDPTKPEKGGTFLCNPTANYSDAWIDAAANGIT